MKQTKIAGRGSAVSFYSRIEEYQHILKSGGFFVGGVNVYGSDKHLVIVTTDGIGESIKYIALENIRAVLIKHISAVPAAMTLTFTLIALLLMMCFGIGEFSRGFVIASLITILFFALMSRGLKNCSLRVVTDVNDHLIPSVHKYRVAKALLDFVAASNSSSKLDQRSAAPSPIVVVEESRP